MSLIIQAAPREHYGWILSRIGYAPTAGLRAIEALTPDGDIAGMAAFDNWMPNSVEMHAAIEKPIALRRLLPAAFEYAFLQCGREYILGITPASRAVILSWRQRFGFSETHRITDGFAKGDDLVYSVLHRDNCTWLQKRRGSNGL